MVYLYVYSVSSPYLFVFDDNRIRNTREHMILQVDLVRPRDKPRLILEEYFLSKF